MNGYYRKHELVEREGKKLLIITSDVLYDEPVRYTNYAVLPTTNVEYRKWIFDPEDIKDIYLTDYRPNRDKDCKTIFISGIVYYRRGLETKFYNVECEYVIEKKQLKPVRKYYEWRYGQWYNTKTGKYIRV